MDQYLQNMDRNMPIGLVSDADGNCLTSSLISKNKSQQTAAYGGKKMNSKH
jgi:hypothetical protein